MAANTGWVSIGTDHDTAAFAVALIRRWWEARGQHDYPSRRPTADHCRRRGSNGYRTRGWKTQLTDLAADTGLEITVCHLPPGTSKWNKIEHRLPSYITMNWRGRPLASHEAMLQSIAATSSRTGLIVHAELDSGQYPTGIRVRDDEIAALPITRHRFHGDWNYTLYPQRPMDATTASNTRGEGRRRHEGRGDRRRRHRHRRRVRCRHRVGRTAHQEQERPQGEAEPQARGHRRDRLPPGRAGTAATKDEEPSRRARSAPARGVRPSADHLPRPTAARHRPHHPLWRGRAVTGAISSPRGSAPLTPPHGTPGAGPETCTGPSATAAACDGCSTCPRRPASSAKGQTGTSISRGVARGSSMFRRSAPWPADEST